MAGAKPRRHDQARGWCSFCSKNYQEVGPVAEGADQVYICLACVHASIELFATHR